jgi:hypothetical protein
MLICLVLYVVGRAITHAVSRWLPTAAARVRARGWSYGICGGQSGAGVGFLRVLRFPLPIFIPPIAPQSPSSIIWGLYNRPEVAAVPIGLSPTPLKKLYVVFRFFYYHGLDPPACYDSELKSEELFLLEIR